MARDVADAFDIGDGCAAEFHHEAAHDERFVPSIGIFLPVGDRAETRVYIARRPGASRFRGWLAVV
jgi:hypothetical protein